MSETDYGLPEILSAQAIYDKVTTHLFRQGRPSMLGDGITCAYRGENRTACAVGCLIDDDDYLRDIESMTVSQLYDPAHSGHIHNPLPKIVKPYQSLLERLQSAHDTSRNSTDDKKNFSVPNLAWDLIRIAQNNNPPLDSKIPMDELEKHYKNLRK